MNSVAYIFRPSLYNSNREKIREQCFELDKAALKKRNILIRVPIIVAISVIFTTAITASWILYESDSRFSVPLI